MATLLKHVKAAVLAAAIAIGATAVLFVFSHFLQSLAHASQKPQVRIAVIDAGMDPKDPRFAPWLCDDGTSYADFTGAGIVAKEPHMTHVAGIIRALAGNSHDYCLSLCRFWRPGRKGELNVSSTEACINWALEQRADIVNYSAGGPIPNESERQAWLRLAMRAVLVFAAGNEGQDLDKRPYYPASYQIGRSVVVGNVDSAGVLAPSSNFGPKVDRYALGMRVWSTYPRARYGYMDGTSMATAVMTGLIVRQRLGGSDLKLEEIPAYLKTFWAE